MCSGQEISDAIKTLSESIGVASSEIIPHYVLWYIWTSVGYMLLAICLFGASVGVFKAFQKQALKDEYNSNLWVAWSWIIVIGAFLLAAIIFFGED